VRAVTSPRRFEALRRFSDFLRARGIDPNDKFVVVRSRVIARLLGFSGSGRIGRVGRLSPAAVDLT
jgi:hypothetical protein